MEERGRRGLPQAWQRANQFSFPQLESEATGGGRRLLMDEPSAGRVSGHQTTVNTGNNAAPSTGVWNNPNPSGEVWNNATSSADARQTAAPAADACNNATAPSANCRLPQQTDGQGDGWQGSLETARPGGASGVSRPHKQGSMKTSPSLMLDAQRMQLVLRDSAGPSGQETRDPMSGKGLGLDGGSGHVTGEASFACQKKAPLADRAKETEVSSLLFVVDKTEGSLDQPLVKGTCSGQSQNSSLFSSEETWDGQDSAGGRRAASSDRRVQAQGLAAVDRAPAQGAELSTEDGATQEMTFVDPAIEEAPRQGDEMMADGTHSFSDNAESKPGTALLLKAEAGGVQLCSWEREEVHSDGFVESEASVEAQSLNGTPHCSHDKENVVRKCSVVLIRQQHFPVEKSHGPVKSKSLKRTSKPLASSVPKRNRALQHKLMKKGLPARNRALQHKLMKTGLPASQQVKDCFVLLTSDQQSGNGKNTKQFTRKFPKLAYSKQPQKDGQKRKSSSKKSANTLPLRDCFVVLNEEVPALTAEQRGMSINMTLKHSPLQSQYQVPQRNRSSQEKNSAPKSASGTLLKSVSRSYKANQKGRSSSRRSTSGLALRDCKQQLTDCFVVIRRGQLDMPKGCRQPLNITATTLTPSAHFQGQSAVRNRSTTSVSSDLQALKDCCVILERQQPVEASQRKYSSQFPASQSTFVPDEDRLPTGRSTGESSAVSELVRSCFVYLSREESGTRRRRSSSSESNQSEAYGVGPLADESIISLSARRNTLYGNRGKAFQLMDQHPCVAPAAVLPRCLVLLSRLPPSTCQQDGGPDNSPLLVSRRGRRSSLNRYFPCKTTELNASVDCSRDLFSVEQAGSRKQSHTVGSESLAAAGNRGTGQSLPYQGPSEPGEGAESHFHSEQPAQKKRGRVQQTQALRVNIVDSVTLRNCSVFLTSLPQSGVTEEPPAKKMCGHNSSDSSPSMATVASSGRLSQEHVECSDDETLPNLQAKRRCREERGRAHRKLSSDDSCSSRSITLSLKECSIALNRLQESAPDRTSLFMDVSILPLPVSSKRRRPAEGFPSKEQSEAGEKVSSAKDRPSLEQSAPLGRGRSANSSLLVGQTETKEKERSTPSAEKTVSQKRGKSPKKTVTAAPHTEARDYGDPTKNSRSTEPSLSNRKGRPVKTPASLSRSEANKDHRSADSTAVELSLPAKRGQSIKEGAIQSLRGPEENIPPSKKARQSGKKGPEQNTETRNQDLNAMMLAAGIWVKPLFEKTAVKTEETLTVTVKSEEAGSGINRNKRDKQPTGSPTTQVDSSSKAGTGRRKKGCPPKSKKAVEQNRQKPGGGIKKELPAARGHSDSEPEKILFIGEDFVVVREQSDFEDGGEEQATSTRREESGKKMPQGHVEKTSRVEESGKTALGEGPAGAGSVVVSLDETDGNMYMQLLPVDDDDTNRG